MKAISVRQPMTWAILSGGCDVVNQPRNIADGYRGPLLVHVGRRLADLDTFARVAELADDTMPPLGSPRRPDLHSDSAIVGAVELSGVHPASSCRGRCSPWSDPTGWHLRLTNPRVLSRAVPCPGKRDLFTPAPEVLEQVRRQLS